MKLNSVGERAYFSHPLDVLYAQLEKDEKQVDYLEHTNKINQETYPGMLLYKHDGLDEDIKRLRKAIGILEGFN